MAGATALVVWQGAGVVAGALLAAGWGLVLVALFHLVKTVLAALGWRILHAGPGRPPLAAFVQARWIREAVNGLLPVTQIGGEFVGARVLSFHGASAGTAGAGVVVDLTMEVASQFAFTLIALALLLLARPGEYAEVARWTLVGLAVFVPAVCGFVVAQRRGMFLAFERFCGWLAARSPTVPPGALDGMHDDIQRIYRQPRALAGSFALHLVSWVAGSLEVWLILALIGSPVSPGEALVLEGLGQAVRSAAFMVPGALGVQEGGYLVLGALYGLAPQTGLTLSLGKRVREVLLGVPGLLAWQALEGRRLWAGRGALGAAGRERGSRGKW